MRLKTTKTVANEIEMTEEFATLITDTARTLELDTHPDAQFRVSYEVYTKDTAMRMFADKMYDSITDMMVNVANDVMMLESNRETLCIASELFIKAKDLRAVSMKLWYRYRSGDNWESIQLPLPYKIMRMSYPYKCSNVVAVKSSIRSSKDFKEEK